jgi:hypothetical protein
MGTLDRLARLKAGEALEGLLSEAAAARQQASAEAPTGAARVEAEQIAELAEEEVADQGEADAEAQSAIGEN